MSYAIELLRDKLDEVEKVQLHCLKCGNQTDSDSIEESYVKNLKSAIRTLEFAEQGVLMIKNE